MMDAAKKKKLVDAAGIVLVAVLAGVGVWMATGEGGEEVKNPEPQQEKRVGAPQAVVEVQETPAAKPAPPPVAAGPKWEWPESRTNELSGAELRKWRIAHQPPHGITNNTASTEAPPKYAIFNHASENEIASLLTMTPGDTLVGTPRYTSELTEDFMASFADPIEILDTDSPEDAALKESMIAVKAELKARIDAGEDLGRILLDARAEYQEMARYKMMLDAELAAVRNNPEASARDVDDFLAAANKMLEERGIAPLELNPISKRILARRLEEEAVRGETE